MNDKFFEILSKSSGRTITRPYNGSLLIKLDLPELEKFAELIVKECVRVCEDDLLDEYMRKCFAAQEEGILYAAVADCCSAMKQHFGVEE